MRKGNGAMTGFKWRSALVGLTVGVLLAGTLPVVAGVGDAVLQGRSNTVNKRTIIRGKSGSAATLRLINESPAGPGLAIKVTPGTPPMRVNSKGHVANLNADLLDGRSGSEYATRKARTGETMIGAFGAAGNGNFLVHAATFPTPLPVGVPQSRIHYVLAGAGSTTDCPGMFRARPGHLCIYASWENNATFSGIGRIDSQILDSGASRYGFTILWTRTANGANVRGNWAYRVPAAADIAADEQVVGEEKVTDVGIVVTP